MENSFCSACGELLVIDTTELKELYYVCPSCSIKVKATSNIIYEEEFNDDDNIPSDYELNFGKYDMTNQVIKGTCQGCKQEKEIIVFKTEKTLKNTYVCSSCKKYWQ